MDVPATIFEHESTVRFGCFFVLFVLIAAAEILAPRRPRELKKSFRWFGNLSVHVLNSVIIYAGFPLLPVGMALLCARKGWALLNHIPLPDAVAILLSILALDLLIFTQHFLLHRIGLLWRLHRMHHTDVDLDITSALRFHPLEIILSMLIKLAAVATLGPPALAVFLFETLLNAMAMFSHANLRLPLPLDALLRRVVITPDMHRIHHSVIMEESLHNYGFNISWWDRLFGTYQAQPASGHLGMTLGIEGFRDARYSNLSQMILAPFNKG